MRNAITQDGVVTNIIKGSLPGVELVPDDGTAQIGGTWDGNAFHPPQIAPAVPQSLSPPQFFCSLNHFGIRAVCDTYVSNGTQDLKDWYARATLYERQHPLVVQAITDLASQGLSAALADQVWTYGASI